MPLYNAVGHLVNQNDEGGTAGATQSKPVMLCPLGSTTYILPLKNSLWSRFLKPSRLGACTVAESKMFQILTSRQNRSVCWRFWMYYVANNSVWYTVVQSWYNWDWSQMVGSYGNNTLVISRLSSGNIPRAALSGRPCSGSLGCYLSQPWSNPYMHRGSTKPWDRTRIISKRHLVKSHLCPNLINPNVV